MSDKSQNLIRTFAVVVGVVVTLITCGIGLGRVQSNVNHLYDEVDDYKNVKEDVSDVKQKMAFLEGTVLAELKNQGLSIIRIEKAVNELTRAD